MVGFIANNLFGNISAEKDFSNLEKDFVNTDKFYASMDSQYSLLRGYKGAGKSAFRCRLEICKEIYKCGRIKNKNCPLDLKFCERSKESKESDFEIIFIKADDLKISELFQLSNSVYYKRNYGIQEEVFDLLNILCKIEVFKRIEELQDNSTYKRFIKKTRFNEGTVKKVASILIKALSSVIDKNPSDINFAEEFLSVLTDTKKDFDEIERVAKEITKNSNKKYYIFFDGFDKLLDKVFYSYAKDEQHIFITNLTKSLIILGYEFQRDDALPSEYENVFPNVYVKVLLPEDFVIDTKLRDNIKYLNESIILHWSKSDLKKFMSTRINSLLYKKHEPINELKADKLWDKMFGAIIENTYFGTEEHSFDYFSRHTFFRPRDFQIICIKVVESLDQAQKFRSYNHFIDYVMENPVPQQYSRFGVNEGARVLVAGLIDEFKMVDFEGLIKLFNKKPNIMPYDKVYGILKEYDGFYRRKPEDLIKTLFNIGFLGKFIEGDKGVKEMHGHYGNVQKDEESNEYYVSLFSFAGHHNAIPDSSNDIAISPVFYDVLNMKVENKRIYP